MKRGRSVFGVQGYLVVLSFKNMANQAWQVISPGKLHLVDLGEPLPKPGDKQILIRLHAAALNYKDRLVVNQDPHYPIPTKPGLVPCIDGAGVVEESGPNSAWKKGDRVVLHGTSWISGNDAPDFQLASCAGAGSVDGTLRRYAVWDDGRVIAAPKSLSMEEACTLFCAGVTASRALFHGPLKLQPGMTVLFQGTGGVSCYAIQVCRSYWICLQAGADSCIDRLRGWGDCCCHVLLQRETFSGEEPWC